MALPVRVERGREPDPLEIARRDVGNVLSRFFGSGVWGDGGDGGDGGALASLSNYGVDIREDAGHVYGEADLPGFRKEDVDISVEDDTLTISAERREEVPAGPPQTQQAQASGQGQPGQQGQQNLQASGGDPPRPGTQARQKADYLLRERRYQRFIRSFTLPPNVDTQHVQARLEDGVLRITLDKREESKPKKVQVS